MCIIHQDYFYRPPRNIVPIRSPEHSNPLFSSISQHALYTCACSSSRIYPVPILWCCISSLAITSPHRLQTSSSRHSPASKHTYIKMCICVTT
ncbi:hypothetical protein HBI16_010160 [Parastagonospora nodorum]|nr:hypothetical protein HBH52_079080 [Parastagonospora nodorum]KAH5787395.1 hypothetical protein HBI16_010160 [Parastagonospora nodorum]